MPESCQLRLMYFIQDVNASSVRIMDAHHNCLEEFGATYTSMYLYDLRLMGVWFGFRVMYKKSSGFCFVFFCANIELALGHRFEHDTEYISASAPVAALLNENLDIFSRCTVVVSGEFTVCLPQLDVTMS